MEGLPADMGDWSLVRIFHEGGRLMKNHFGDFLPVILLFIFPASLIKVVHTQFLAADFVGPQGSTDPEPRPLWTVILLRISLDGVPQILFVVGFVVMFQVLKDKIYLNETYETESFHSGSFFSTVILALTPKEVDTETSASLKDQVRTTPKGKFLKALAALAVCYILFEVISTSGVNFTPEAIAATGLPPWTIALFMLLIAVITAVSTSYFLLVALLVAVWIMYSPRTPILA